MKNPGTIARLVHDKYLNGDPIGDTELAMAVIYWRELSEKLMPLGPRFDLAWREANRIWIALDGFANARMEK